MNVYKALSIVPGGGGSSQKSDTDLGQTLALPLISCVNLSKPRLSLPQFPQVQNGDN